MSLEKPIPLQVFKGGTTYTSPADYSLTGNVLTWNGDKTDNVRIEFDYFVSGKCSEPPPHPSAGNNAMCLVLSHPGIRLGGLATDLTGELSCEECLKAVRLIECTSEGVMS